MGVLRNPKHELFAQEIAKGINGALAYRSAGYKVDGKTSAVNASRLAKDARVSQRIAELLIERQRMAIKSTEKAVEALSIDREWVLRLLKENAERAMQAAAVKDKDGYVIGEYKYDGAVANRALELLGKELGMFIDRTENKTVIHTVESEPLTDDEWAAEHATAH